jgi:hypothetical protein
MAVGEIFARRCITDGVEVTCWVVSALPELISMHVGMEFSPWMVEATELHPWKECLSAASVITCVVAGGSQGSHKGLCVCGYWAIRTTWVMSRWGLWEGIVQYRHLKLGMYELFHLPASGTAAKVDS